MLSSLIFIALFGVSFVAMEAVSYFAHRFLFHGIFWSLHQSHHLPRKGAFERNDWFALFFVPISIILMGGWLAPDWLWLTFPIGTGMTAYGAAYFFVHDIFTHRRVAGLGAVFNVVLNWKNPWLLRLRAAHRHHHAEIAKKGQEPFGFLWFSTFKPKPSSRAE